MLPAPNTFVAMGGIYPCRTTLLSSTQKTRALLLGSLQTPLIESKKIMSGLLKAKSDIVQAMGVSLKERAVLSDISKAKAKGETPDAMAIRAARDPSSSTSTLTIIAEVST
jgi:hypothetical protein